MHVVDNIWDVNFIKKFEGEHLLGKGRMKKVRGNGNQGACPFSSVV
jgi:hypothetical protein